MERDELRAFLHNCLSAAKREHDDAVKKDLIRYSSETLGRMMAYEHIIQKLDS